MMEKSKKRSPHIVRVKPVSDGSVPDGRNRMRPSPAKLSVKDWHRDMIASSSKMLLSISFRFSRRIGTES